MRRSFWKILHLHKLLCYSVKLTFLTLESLEKKIISEISFSLYLKKKKFEKKKIGNKNTMVASNMGLLRRMAKWNLGYMNVDLDCILHGFCCFIFCVLV